MTATERLRALLDERGVEWHEPTMKPNTTWFPDAYGINCRVKPWGDALCVKRYDLTPEQAVEATLGGDLQAENAKLRELCADMYGFIKRMDEDCGDVTFSDCFDYCKHDTANDGCCKTGECWYEQRMHELGVEV